MNKLFLFFFILILSSGQNIAQSGCPTGFEPGINLLKNPRFDEGISGFYSDYKKTPSKDWFQGSIYATDKPSDVHNNYRLCLDTNFKNQGTMLVVDGAEDRNKIVWAQKPKVEPNTDYYFAFFFATLLKPNPAQLEITINNVRLSKPFNYNYQHCRGSIYFCFWNSGNAMEADIKIKAYTTELMGNDFVLDNFQFFSCKKKEEPQVAKPIAIVRDSILVQIKTSDKSGAPLKTTTYLSFEGDSVPSAFQTDSTGKLSFSLKNKNAYLNIHSANHFVLKDSISASLQYTDSILVKNYTLNPLDSGVSFTLKNLTFERYSFALNENSKKDLEMVLELLNENPNIKLEIHGHTDNQGDAVMNYELSLERVKSVKKYLIEKGTDETRLKEIGFGGTKPLVGYGTDEERKQNRRVEFVITRSK